MKILKEIKHQDRKILTVEIPFLMVNKLVEKSIQDIANSYKLPGFRPGKIPINLIKNKYHKNIKLQIINDLINAFIKKQDDNINVNQQIKIIQNLEHHAVIFEVITYFNPNIDINLIENINILNINTKITDYDINEMIYNIREKLFSVKNVAKNSNNILCINENDHVIINVSATYKNKIFINLIENVKIRIKKQYEFEKKFIDHKLKENLSFFLTFLNKEIKFNVYIKNIIKINIPKINNKFFIKLGIKDKNLETLKKNIKNNMIKEFKNIQYKNQKKQIQDNLLKIYKFELPIYLQNIIEQKAKMHIKNLATENTNISIKNLIKHLTAKLKLNIIFKLIIQKIDFNVYQENVNVIADNLSSFQMNSNYKEIKNYVFEKKIIDFLLSKCKLENKEYNFFDFYPETQSFLERIKNKSI